MVEDKATHVLVFSTQGNNLNDLQVALKKQTPAWVQQTSSTNDTAIKQDQAEQDKTFGFRYLVAGVEEAYWNVFGREAYLPWKFCQTITYERSIRSALRRVGAVLPR